MPTGHHNNLYQLEFGGGSIGRRDAKTLEVTIWPTPGALSRPRRGRVGEQSRLWFAEYGGNRVREVGTQRYALTGGTSARTPRARHARRVACRAGQRGR